MKPLFVMGVLGAVAGAPSRLGSAGKSFTRQACHDRFRKD